MVICPNINQLTSIVGKPWIYLFATKQLCLTRPRRTDIQRRCPDNTLGRQMGPCVSTHALLPSILSKSQSEDYIVLLIAPAFLQARWFKTLLSLSIEIPVRLLASRGMHKQPLSHVFHRQSEALCLYVLTLSQN